MDITERLVIPMLAHTLYVTVEKNLGFRIYPDTGGRGPSAVPNRQCYIYTSELPLNYSSTQGNTANISTNINPGFPLNLSLSSIYSSPFPITKGNSFWSPDCLVPDDVKIDW